MLKPRVLGHLNTRIVTVRRRPGNIGVGRGYKSARLRDLGRAILGCKTSINVTGSNSTSHYLTISRGNRRVSNSRVVLLYTVGLGTRNQLGRSAIINAIVDGVNFRGTLGRVNYGARVATINSHCILRGVHGSNCSLNNRRSNRVVFLSCGAANSNLLATIRLLDVVGRRRGPLSRLTKLVAHCPRVLGGIHIRAGSK